MEKPASPPPQPSTAAAELALQVVTNAALLPEITSFLPGVPVWTVEYEHNLGPKTDELTPHQRAKMSMGTAGLLPRLAIHHSDLETLARLYKLHSQPQFLHKGKFWFDGAMHAAALSGHVDVLQWLHDNTSCKPRSDTVNCAAREGHAAAVRWLLANYTEHLSERFGLEVEVERVAADGHLQVLKVVMDVYTGRVGEATNQAAGNGHLDVVIYLCGVRSDACSRDTVDRAAGGGHPHVLKWLLENQSQPFTHIAVFDAVARGHIEVARFLWETRNCWTAGASSAEHEFKTGVRNGISHAIRTGDVGMVTFLLEILPEELPLYALTTATTHGHLELVKTLHRTGRPQRDLDEALVTAKRGKHRAIVKFLLDPLAADGATSEEDAPDPQFQQQPATAPPQEDKNEKADHQEVAVSAASPASSDGPRMDAQPSVIARRRILRARRR